jgi:Icc-related predicted phosphoesterase
MPLQKLRLICISDTHNASPTQGYTLPPGDILIHAGDLTNNGTSSELLEALTWIRKADYECKIVIAGNHDVSLDRNFPEQHGDAAGLREMVRRDGGFVYLEHESAVVNVRGVKVKILGSPFSAASVGKEKTWAFQYRPEQAEELWSSVPQDTTILVTHTPVAGHLDTSAHWAQGGCAALAGAVFRIKPMLHVCGHCHEGRGGRVVHWDDEAEAEHGVTEWRDPGSGNKRLSVFDLTGRRAGTAALRVGRETAIVNASVMAKSYGRGVKTSNKPVVVDIEMPCA